MERLWAVVRGRVQGVYFRAAARDQARQLGLSGWVRNCSDGSVEYIAEGTRPQLERFFTWSRSGPPHAVVTSVETEWQQATGEFLDFAVRY